MLFLHYENKIAGPDPRMLFLILPNLSNTMDYRAIENFREKVCNNECSPSSLLFPTICK